MTDENKLGVLLHELTHIKTLTDLEDKDEDVWRTGPFYQNFTIGKDPVGIWGKDLLKSLKKKLPDNCCPKPEWPYNGDSTQANDK